MQKRDHLFNKILIFVTFFDFSGYLLQKMGFCTLPRVESKQRTSTSTRPCKDTRTCVVFFFCWRVPARDLSYMAPCVRSFHNRKTPLALINLSWFLQFLLPIDVSTRNPPETNQLKTILIVTDSLTSEEGSVAPNGNMFPIEIHNL